MLPTTLPSTEVPAVQLVETAKAILEDDAALGFHRNDKVLKRIAKGGPTHAVSFMQLEWVFVFLKRFAFYILRYMIST